MASRLDRLTIVLILAIFAGSIFATSSKFVDAENAVKFYFTVIALLIGIIVGLLMYGRVKLNVQMITSLSVMKGFYVVGVLQSLYGVLQYSGMYPSNHSSFAVTGSFDNPAGFIAVLSLLFPIGVFWCIKSKNLEQRLVFFSIGLILFSIIISGSRTGLLAIVISTVTIFIFEFYQFFKKRYFEKIWFFVLFFTVVLLTGIFVLYKWRPDSANGRLLIWEVSSEMIKDKPVLGHGYGIFQASYMDYQAGYLKTNPDSEYAQLADNVKHPFNEYIKVAVEFGIVGIVMVFLITGLVLWAIVKSRNKNRIPVIGGLLSFFVLACFSYPLQYIAVWLLLAFYLFAMLPPKEISIKNTHVSIIVRILVLIICVFSLYHLCLHMSAEIKWKTIAVASLKGNTKEMLPEYEKLYSGTLKHNPFFLYNYGAELNVAEDYSKSILLLSECRNKFNDYDLQMLLADSYYHTGDTIEAVNTYQYASNMIPCRFLPLYNMANIYLERGDSVKAVIIANKILKKTVKVPSSTVNFIKAEMKQLINPKK